MTSIFPAPAMRVAIAVVDDIDQQFLENLAAEFRESLLDTLALPIPALVFSKSNTAERALSGYKHLGNIDPCIFIGHDAECPWIARFGDLDRG